ncbi:MAG: histidine--tRNA ligase [Promethearchaeota archaeon]
MVELRILKGTKDYSVKEKLLQNYILKVFTEVFQKYGFNPIETPILEFKDILVAKYAGGAEIVKEIYSLKDNGNRDLALRYDLTVPFCRFVGMNRNLLFPFKRYEIGKVFRDGPVKLGRLREFYQCDADVVGSSNLLYDAECLAIMSDAFKMIGNEFYIEINNRKLLFGIIKQAGIESESLASSIILSIDKLKKIGEEGVKEELIQKGIGESTFQKIFDYINRKGANEELIKFYQDNLTNDLGREGIEEIVQVLDYCKKMGIADNIVFRPELARGLEIYTGTIFEAFFKNSKITSSIAGGGRYDKIIGKYLGQNKIVPAVGFSIGVDVILSDIINNPEAYPNIDIRETSVQVLIVPIRVKLSEIIPIATSIRNADIKCDIFTKKKKSLIDILGLANTLKIPIVLLVGKKELEQQKITLKDMKNEQQYSIELKNLNAKINEILQNLEN